MDLQKLKTEAKFVIKAIDVCKQKFGNFYFYKTIIPYSIYIEGTIVNCKHYVKHDAFFISFANDLEIELLDSKEKIDNDVMLALKNFNDCEDLETFDISTIVNFVLSTSVLCTASYLAAHYYFDIADIYTVPACIAVLGYEVFQSSQTLCPDQLREDLVSNLTKWSEE